MFSPSAYKKAFSDITNSPVSNANGLQKPKQKRRSSAMDMFHQAHTESRAEQVKEADEAYVRNMYHNDAKQHQRRAEERRAQEEKNEQYAQKVQLEEHDSAFAEHLHEMEHRKHEQEKQLRLEEEKLSEDIAKKLQAQEEQEHARETKALKKRALQDAKVARKVHKKNIQDLKREEKQQRKEEMKLLQDNKKSEHMAKQLQAQEERDRERDAKNKQRRASKDEKLARKYHEQELNLVKKEEREEQRKAWLEKKNQEKMKKMNEKSQAIAQRLQEEEHRSFMKENERRQLQHEEDARMARELQGDELGEVATQGSTVRDAWSNPKVEVEETKSGAVITVQLPNVRRMEVDLDEEENTIFVSAKPKSADRVVAKLTDAHDAHDELKKIVESQFVGELKPISFEIKLDDIVDGLVTADDIVSEYQAKTGLLRLELCGVVAKSKVEQKKFKKGLLSRLGSLFNRKSGGSKANKK